MIDQAKLKRMLRNEADMAFKRRVKTILEYLDVQPHDRVLDCGCGRGFFLKYIGDFYPAPLFGLDREELYLGIARRELGYRVGLACGDIAHLPFADRSFDKIILSEILEHLPDDLGGLLEVKRVLKTGGLLAITVPNHNYPFWWDPVNKTLEALFHAHVRTGLFAGIWANHVRLYYREEIVALVERAGFRIEDVRAFTHYCFPFAHNIVYGVGKPLFESGLLPRGLNQAADRFRGEENNSSLLNPINWGLAIFNLIDRLNDRVTNPGSSVIISVKARKG
jgi:SAM-dependent methyltransferase